MSTPSAEDMTAIRHFIAKVEWRFAKTMAWCPHYYNVLAWNPAEQAGFLALTRAIFEHGTTRVWPPPNATGKVATCRKRMVTYLEVDGFKYWVMDPTVAETTLINRAVVEDE